MIRPCAWTNPSVAMHVNGKMRGTITLAPGATQDAALAAAQETYAVQRQLNGKTIRKIIWAPKRDDRIEGCAYSS